VWDFAPFDRRWGAPLGSLFERATAPLAVRRARQLIAISESTRDELARRLPRSRGRITVAHPSADAAFTADAAGEDVAIRERIGISKPYVLSVGTLEPRKNLPRLIEAFAALPAAVRGDQVLVLAGATGWQTDRTFERVAAHGDLVQTLGFVADADLPALYRGATVFCYPSLYEGFGIPVLEAMRCGVPVLTSATSSMPEVGGGAARYVDPESTAAIRDGLAALLMDPALRARMAHEGPVRAQSFDWAQSARRILDVLEEASA
jgi:glycosyltransferase involved in cell wall biosynthesis